MDRRTFAGRVFAGLSITGLTVRPAKAKPGSVPRRTFGKTGVSLSIIGQGGAKLAYLRTKEAAAEHVHYALTQGINYFDCARSYWDGHSEEVYGDVLPKARKEIFLTTKSLKRSRAEAEAELDASLKAMKTDYVDLWQMHNIRTVEDIQQIFGPGGAMEAFAAAKKKGKCRFIGFTAHYDPAVALKMLNASSAYDTVLVPLHAADPSYLSFEKDFLPAALAKGVAIQGMKVFGSAALLRSLHVSECLRYTLTLPVHAAVVGCSSPGHWDDNGRALERFKPMGAEEMATMRERATSGVAAIKGPALEYWKRQTP